MEQSEIEVRCVLDLMARPKGAAVDALKNILGKLQENGKELKVYGEEYSEEKEVANGFFSAFVTFKLKSDVLSIFNFVLDNAPSSVEVLATGDIKVSAPDLQAAFNDTSGRLEEMDKLIKLYSAKATYLEQQMKEKKETEKQEPDTTAK